MERFQSMTQFQQAVITLGDSNNIEDFYSLQHFYFGCCNWLRGFIEWPKVKEAYDKCKLAIGCRSIFMKPPRWRDFGAFRGEHRKSAQYTIYVLLADLQEYQDMMYLVNGSYNQLRGLWKVIPSVQLFQIWKDTVISRPKFQNSYPIEVRRMGWEIRSTDRYREIGVLGDLCDDFGLQEEADHFRDPTCLHTYGCRYLHNVCRGMDGR